MLVVIRDCRIGVGATGQGGAILKIDEMPECPNIQLAVDLDPATAEALIDGLTKATGGAVEIYDNNDLKKVTKDD